jgi:D-alanine transaminase
MVYIQITRGVAPRTHYFPSSAPPLEFLYVQEIGDPYTKTRVEGVRVSLQPDQRWGRCDIKSTNLLANVLAMQAAREAGGAEALLVLPDGTVTEGSHSSLFGVVDGGLRTAPNSPDILPGTTRDLVLRLAAELDIPVVERALRRQEPVSELFLTGTTSEVLPVIQVDDQVIGGGQPGPITRRLQQAYREAVARFREEQR